MDNFTVKNANRWMEAGGTRDSQSIGVNNGGAGPISIPSLGDGSEAPKSFADTLNAAIGKVNELQLKADKGAQDLATGRTDNIADVMLSTEKADIALRLMVQVRNKMIDAYQEIMKMQV